jgi:NhaP-type Na+/H+ or K+/H+ antiporter
MATIWFLVVGALLIFMGLAGSAFARLPCSSSMFYLVIGFGLGPAGVGLIHLSLQHDTGMLRLVAELAVLVSLFAVGLRMRVPLIHRIWLLPLRLGVLAMMVTIGLLAVFGVFILRLSWAEAVLLGAILAPTDPVLAHDVQIKNAGDHDFVRFTLSGEGGLNDGTAFPFVLLGLAMLTLGERPVHALSQWLALNLIWGVSAGLASGWLLGGATERLVVHLRSRFGQAMGLDGFFLLGLIALSYGVALAIHSYGFLAVFAAGLSMRHAEQKAARGRSAREVVGHVNAEDVDATATDPTSAHAFMTETVLGFALEIERIGEVTVMLIIGSLLSSIQLDWRLPALIAVLFVIVRPLSSELSLLGSAASPGQRRLMSWFGIRGVGSFYYLLYAIENTPHGAAARFAPWVLGVIAASVVVHGISGTPLMDRYQRGKASR